MSAMQSTVLVVPCYNEAARLNLHAFADAVASDPTLSILFVDDGSQDATGALIEASVAARPEQLALLSLGMNVGKAEAVRRGLLAAFARAPALVGYLDADLATPLSELAGMRTLFDRPELQFVLGSRVALLGRQVRRSPQRHYVGRVFASAASLLLGLEVYDTQCGAKLFRNSSLVRGVFAEPFNVNWTFDVEVLARLRAAERAGGVPDLRRIGLEYPLQRWQDVAGSRVRLKDGVRAGRELLRLWAKYRR